MSENETNEKSKNETTLVCALVDITKIEKAGRTDKTVYRDMAARIEARNRKAGDTLIAEAMQESESCELCGDDVYLIGRICEDCNDHEIDSSYENIDAFLISPWDAE